MTAAESLNQKFTVRVLELNDLGVQPKDIEEDSEIQSLGLALWGKDAVRKIIRFEIRRTLQNDVDKETGVRNRISVPKLPMPEPERQEPSPADQRQREYLKTVLLDPERELIAVQELCSSVHRLIAKRGILTAEEEGYYFKAESKVLKSAKARLAQVNGLDIVE